MPDSVPLEDELPVAPVGGGDARGFDVFLSHNSRDKPLVERIAERLKRARLEPWLDAWDLVPGTDWQRGLAEGLAASRSCAVFVGPGDLGAWANEEVAVALDRAATDAEFRVFLVLLPGLPERFDAARLRPFLRMRTWVDYRGGLDDERAFQALVSAIKGLPLGPAVPIEPDSDVSPYRGLEVFEEEHAKFFFGREADVQRLLEQMKGKRFVAVLGASGSGKSSLVRAGLVPALRRGPLSGDERWEIVILRPGAHPLEALAVQLLRVAPGGGMQQTLDALASDPRTLHLAGSLALAERPRGTRLLLVVDQFEEVFTLSRDERERSAFFANLLYAATIPDGGSGVLLAMRADFYHRCGAYPELAQQLAAEQYLVSPLQRDGLRQAVGEPARRVGLAFEPGLVATILDDVGDQPGALPLLEHALLEVWRRRRGGILTLAGYRESGGVQGAIAHRADDVFGSFTPEQQEIARRTLLRLTQPGEETEDTRRRAQLSELALRADETYEVEAVVQRLVDSRLLTTDTEAELGEQWVDVAHEALIRGWPRLQRWIDEDRAGLRVHRRLTEATQEWKQKCRDEGLLYRGSRLAEAAVWRERNEEALNELERAFLDASAELRGREQREAEERRQKELESARQLAAAQQRAKQRLLWVALVLLVGIVGAGAAATVARQEKNDAERASEVARSGELVSRSNSELDRDPYNSLLLALEAMDVAPTPEAEAALRRSLLSPLRRVLLGHEEAVRIVAFSRNGKLLVTAGEGTARIWQSADGKPVAVLRGHKAAISSAAFSSDAKRVVTASRDGTARVWESASGKQLTVWRSDEDARRSAFWWRDEDIVRSAAFSPDAKLVVTTGDHGTAHVWRARDAKPLAALKVAADGEVACAFFNPDGSRVVAASAVANVARVWQTTSWARIATFSTRSVGGAGIAACSPDGGLAATAPNGGDVSIWAVTSGKRVAVLRSSSPVHRIDFSPHSNVVVTSEAGTARAWHAMSGKQIAVLRLPGLIIGGTVPLSPDGKLILTLSGDLTPRIWQVATGKQLAVLRGHRAAVTGAGFSRDGRLVVTGSNDGTARIWQVPRQQVAVLEGHKATVRDAAFSPDGKLVVTASEDSTARVWQAATGKQLAVFTGQDDFLSTAAFNANGKLVVTTAHDGRPRVWLAATGKQLAVLTGQYGVDSSAAFSPDGQLVVTASGAVRVWHAATGKQLAVLSAPRETFVYATFSPDGELVAAVDEVHTARVWHVATRKQLAVLSGQRARLNNIAFSPDGELVATASNDHTARIWDSSTGKQLTVLSGHRSDVNRAAFSPDGKLVLTAGAPLGTIAEDNTARVWVAATGKQLTVLRHEFPLETAVFSPDGNLVLTASRDKTARLWQAANGEQLAVFSGHKQPLTSAAFSPDGKLVVTASSDHTARVYSCPACGPVEEVLDRAERISGMTPTQREAFLSLPRNR